MKRKLVPVSTRDRVFAALVPVSVAVSGWSLTRGINWLAALWGFNLIVSILNAYILQDQPTRAADSDKYSEIIDRISTIGAELSALSVFLEGEKARIAATEQTISRLDSERLRLEPVISTQRDTVEAILSAHTSRLARNVWKERLIGFGLGVVASLIASFAYEAIKR